MTSPPSAVANPDYQRSLSSILLRPEFVTLFILVLFQTYLITASEGFHKIDEGLHFMNNVTAFSDPSNSIGAWQRFGRVWLYAVPAQFGHKTVKVFASLLFLLSIYVAYKVAETERIPGKEWIIVLAGFQPIFLDISYTCFAESPAAFLLILSYYLYKKSQWWLSLLTASLVFLFRFEMSIVAIILFFLALKERKYAALPFALVGPLVWFSFAWLVTGDPLSMVREFIQFSHYPKYVEGTSLDHYVSSAAEIFGVVQIGLLAVFLLYDLFEKHIRLPFISFTVLFCLVINTLAASKDLHWTGSVGDLRYLVPVAPFVGILALSGMSNFLESIKTSSSSKYVPYALAGIAMFSTITTVKPHHLIPMEHGVMAMSREAASDSTDIPILSNHWAAKFALLSDRKQMSRIRELSMKTYAAQPRSYIIWDPLIANSPFSQEELTFDRVRSDPAVRIVDSVIVNERVIYLFLKNPKMWGKQ